MLFARWRSNEWPPGRCHCDLWKKNPKILIKQGVPEGFCGFCDKCGAPGHVLHFPGAVPVTLGWCRKHYYRAMLLHPLGSTGIFVWGGIALLAIVGVIATVTWFL